MPWIFAAILAGSVVLGGLTTLGEDAWILDRISTLLEAADVTAIS